MARPIEMLGPDLRRTVDAMVKGSRDAATAAVKQAAEAGRVEQEKVMRADSGGDLRLSGVNRAKGRAGNTKVGVRVKVTGAGTAKPSATIQATGPLQLIANPTSGHVIRSAYARGRARRGFVGPTLPGQFAGGRQAVLNIPGVGFRRSARHPGTKGKDTWRKGERKAQEAIDRAVQRAVDREMTQAWMRS